MREMTFHDNGKTFTRISKAEARKRVGRGERVYVCACNLRPFGPWYCGMWIDSDFDRRINSFEFYSCTNSETGYYASFYKEEI